VLFFRRQILIDTGQLAALVAITSSAISSVTDLRSGRIPNVITYSTALIGITIGIINQINGVSPGPIDSLLGLGGAFLLFGTLMSIGSLGGGDVKLMAAIGALMGFPFIINSGVRIVAIGAAMALIVTIYRSIRTGTLPGSLYRLISVVTLTIPIKEVLADQKSPGKTLPFAPAICLGVISTVLSRDLFKQ
jgi:Flp pilus assembly protein protease CpaA